MSELTNLITLRLDRNQISGTLPSLAFAANLSYVWLNQNFFSGTVPSDFAGSELRQLEVSQNRLRGSVPQEFAKLTNLEYIDLSRNKFTTLPAELGAVLGKLNGTEEDRKCDLTQNYFTCPIPSELKYPSPCQAVCGDNYIEDLSR
jgi:hypothetical protein